MNKITKPRTTQVASLAKVVSEYKVEGMLVISVIVPDVYRKGWHRVGRAAVLAFTDYLEWYLTRHPEMVSGDPRNIVQRVSYLPAGMRAWRGYMPGGFATFYAHNPEVKRMRNGKAIDTVTTYFFRHTYDAVGLRSRSSVLVWRVRQRIDKVDAPFVWLSIAAGSGQNVYTTLSEILPEKVAQARVVLLDSDPDVLEFARELYEHSGVTVGNIEFVCDDVCGDAVLERYSEERPFVIDAMGLFEYLDDCQAVMLLRRVYELLRPGGIFVFTNMTRSRKHLAVHQRALGWPGVIQRQPEDLLQLFRTADIPPQSVNVFIPDDGVYAIYEVAKWPS